MKLTILGKYGPYPAVGGATSGYLIESDQSVLLDCGSGVFARLCEFCAPESLAGIVLSHLHFDHISDLGVLSYYLLRVGRTLDVWLPADPVRLPIVERMGGFRLHVVADGDEIRVGDFRAQFVSMRHPVPTLGVRLTDGTKTFCYTGDTNESDALPSFLSGADLALFDGGFLERDWSAEKPHLSVRRCAAYAKAANIKAIISHLNPLYDEEVVGEEARSVWQKAELAQERKAYEI